MLKTLLGGLLNQFRYDVLRILPLETHKHKQLGIHGNLYTNIDV